MLHFQDGSMARYPVHALDLNKVALTENPLDDYQRLYFATLRQGDRDLSGQVKRVTYKSNIADSFANPVPSGSENSGYHPKQNVLDCYEYQLPDISTSKEPGAADFASVTEERKRSLKLDSCPRQILKGSIVRDEQTPPVTGSALEGEDTSATLTKNQQFKLRKLDHNQQKNERLINANNCILWTQDSGYVFLTGIWRLYQDVMRGLIHVPRVGQDAADHSFQDSCVKDLTAIIDYALYQNSNDPTSPTSTGGFDRRKRRSSLSNDVNIQALSTQYGSNPGASNASGGGSFSSNYTDLHWNNLVPDLKDEMLELYKSFLLNNKGISSQGLPEFTVTDIIKRIRGGYIKIQGTWSPLEIARLLCARFCFPIRYLLVPIFGEDFPKECEEAFNNVYKKLNDASLNSTVTTNYQFDNNPVRLNGSQFSFVQTPKRKKKIEAMCKKRGQLPARLDLSGAGLAPNCSGSFEKQRSFSWAPESDPLIKRQASQEKLPPISTIMDSLSEHGSSLVERHSYQPVLSQKPNQVSMSPNNYYSERPPSRPQRMVSDPTVQTLSHLATFYTTNGHKYSYPGNVYMSHQRQSPITENFHHEYFEPPANSSIYPPTQNMPPLGQMYYGFSPAQKSFSSAKDSEHWYSSQPSNYAYIQDPNANGAANYSLTNQRSFSATR